MRSNFALLKRFSLTGGRVFTSPLSSVPGESSFVVFIKSFPRAGAFKKFGSERSGQCATFWLKKISCCKYMSVQKLSLNVHIYIFRILYSPMLKAIKHPLFEEKCFIWRWREKSVHQYRVIYFFAAKFRLSQLYFYSIIWHLWWGIQSKLNHFLIHFKTSECWNLWTHWHLH